MPLANDLRAFEHAYRAEGPYVAAVMGRLAVPSEAVRDAVQDVFVAAYRRWGEFDRERPVRPWLTGFARRIAFRYRRSAARRTRKGTALRLVHAVHSPAPSRRVHARDFLERFLVELEPGHREAFVRAEIEGKTAPEIAAELDISVEAVYGRVRSTRRKLKQALLHDARKPDSRAAALVPPWGLVLEQISAATPVATTGGAGLTAATMKAFAATAGAGLVGLSVVAFAVATPSQASAPRQPASVASVATESPRPDAAPTPPKEMMPRVVSAEPEALDDPPIVPSPVAAALTVPRVPMSRPTAAVGPPETPRPSLAEETALLSAAKRLLGAGQPAAALRKLEEHAERHPDGQLADARRRARIRVLCDLGREAQARGEALSLARARPGDPLAKQAVSICSRSSIQNGASPENSK